MENGRPRRQRDPRRKDRILSAAAELAARRGFHTIAMADIGAEAGIVGSGVYRHFESKTAILVALLDTVMNRLREGSDRIVAQAADDRTALSELVKDHIAVAIEDRAVLAVYHREAHTLPERDRRRLRRAQRLYLEEWVHLLTSLRPELSDPEARVTVHAAVGAIQSTLFFDPGLEETHLAALLASTAQACLGLPSLH
ncbi:TetR/AcrR family transcriptional regulator [Pseudonocardia spinosispora]|uniref:TetR/AcrR family transcriptional regulator n=1 Tax=Pseudonocardia spinosispora TaxID=103441 RepID=UPI0003F576A9|nr:TetR/AcrR family transcriptional regulator [Pseudonocardia spinosispora]